MFLYCSIKTPSWNFEEHYHIIDGFLFLSMYLQCSSGWVRIITFIKFLFLFIVYVIISPGQNYAWKNTGARCFVESCIFVWASDSMYFIGLLPSNLLVKVKKVIENAMLMSLRLFLSQLKRFVRFSWIIDRSVKGQAKDEHIYSYVLSLRSHVGVNLALWRFTFSFINCHEKIDSELLSLLFFSVFILTTDWQ